MCDVIERSGNRKNAQQKNSKLHSNKIDLTPYVVVETSSGCMVVRLSSLIFLYFRSNTQTWTTANAVRQALMLKRETNITSRISHAPGFVTPTAINPAANDEKKCRGLPSGSIPMLSAVCLMWSYAGNCALCCKCRCANRVGRNGDQ